MRMDFKIKGESELLKKLQDTLSTIEHEAGAAMKTEMEFVMTESKKEVPVDTGTLRSSGFVSEPTIKSGQSVEITVGYGGPATQVNPKTGQPMTDYAEKVHEDLNAYHHVGKAKFLEDPLNRALPELGTKIADRILKGVK